MHSVLRAPLWLALGLAWFAVACNPDPDFRNEGPLGFDRDTVNLDTLFRNTPSSTRRLIIFNEASHPLRIARIRVVGGSSSPFELMVDGRVGNDLSDFEVLEGDSLWAFVRMQSDVTNNQHSLVTDELEFIVGNTTQRIPLKALVLNAYLYRDTVFAAGGTYTLPSDTLIVVDGQMIVDENAHLIIQAGTRMHFTPRVDADFNRISGIYVLGRLSVNGAPGSEVLFTNNRLDNNYQRTPGQWSGIQFTRFSAGSSLNWAIVQNASIAVRVDSVAFTSQPKLRITNCILRNNSNYGLLALGFADNLGSDYMIDAANVLSYNNGQAALGVLGGGYNRIQNSTFAEYGWDFTRNTPAFVYTNTLRYDSAEFQILRVYPGLLEFNNNVVWGTQPEEYGQDLVSIDLDAATDFRNNLVRASENAGIFSINGNTGNRLNQDPLFACPTPNSDYQDPDFRLRSGSPAINLGLDGLPGSLSTDLRMAARVSPTDAGAYEHQSGEAPLCP